MSDQSAHAFTGRHMLSIMLAFFGTIFSANMTMVYFATHSWTGLVVENAYVASQEFNATTSKLAQAASDVHAVVNYREGRLTITLTDNAGNAIDAMNVRVTLGRPSHEGEDHTIVLLAQGNGIHAVNHSLAKGQWSGSVTAEIAGHEQWVRPLRLLAKD
jgi:nitrogen fixation protein FixH